MKLGILTGGGDCPGLNCVIRSVVVVNLRKGTETVGIRRGWRGLIEGEFVNVTPEMVAGTHNQGGTILGSSRTNPFKDPSHVEMLKENWKAAGLDGLIAVGGEDTLSVSEALNREGLNVISVPKTMSNKKRSTAEKKRTYHPELDHLHLGQGRDLRQSDL